MSISKSFLPWLGYPVALFLLVASVSAQNREDVTKTSVNVSAIFAALESLPYENQQSYAWIAGWHGGAGPSARAPQNVWWCPHEEDTFLPWHRKYLEIFETAMKKIDNSSSLPYWDWFAKDTNGEYIWIPDILKKNPSLSSAVTPWSNIPPFRTVRGTRGVSALLFLEQAIEQALALPYFERRPGGPSFMGILEDVHGTIHSWVGGDMASIEQASYDPIFWFHHSNVDRVWASWQTLYPQVSVSLPLLNTTLRPPQWGQVFVRDLIPPPKYDKLIPKASDPARFFVRLANIPIENPLVIAVRLQGELIGFTSVFAGGGHTGQHTTVENFVPIPGNFTFNDPVFGFRSDDNSLIELSQYSLQQGLIGPSSLFVGTSIGVPFTNINQVTAFGPGELDRIQVSIVDTQA